MIKNMITILNSIVSFNWKGLYDDLTNTRIITLTRNKFIFVEAVENVRKVAMASI